MRPPFLENPNPQRERPSEAGVHTQRRCGRSGLPYDRPPPPSRRPRRLPTVSARRPGLGAPRASCGGFVGRALGGGLGRAGRDGDQRQRRPGGELRIQRPDEPRGLEPSDAVAHRLPRVRHRRDNDPHRRQYGACDDQDGSGEWGGRVGEEVERRTRQVPCVIFLIITACCSLNRVLKVNFCTLFQNYFFNLDEVERFNVA